MLYVLVLMIGLAGCVTPTVNGASKQVSSHQKKHKKADNKQAQTPEEKPNGPQFTVEEPWVLEGEIEFTSLSGQAVRLSASWFEPVRPVSSKTTVVFVPNPGAHSKDGLEESDGIQPYTAPVAVQTAWATALSQRGLYALTYDGRACLHSEDNRCYNNPLDDIDAKGPVAFAADVDAACAYAYRKGAEQVVLWSAPKSVGITLSSACAKKAALVVLQSPVLNSIDKTLPAALKSAARGLPPSKTKLQIMNKANSLSATFESIRMGSFADGSKVMGRSLAFWKAYIALGKNTKAMLERRHKPVLIFTGYTDALMNTERQNEIKAIKSNHRQWVGIEGVDQNLLKQEEVSLQAANQVVGSVLEALQRSHIN